VIEHLKQRCACCTLCHLLAIGGVVNQSSVHCGYQPCHPHSVQLRPAVRLHVACPGRLLGGGGPGRGHGQVLRKGGAGRDAAGAAGVSSLQASAAIPGPAARPLRKLWQKGGHGLLR
jgi:hypothetical protein